MKKGETIVQYKHEMMHMTWRNKKYVNMLSTASKQARSEYQI